MIDSLRNGKVIRAKFLPSFIRSTELVDPVKSELEEDGGSNTALALRDENDKTKASVDNMLLDVRKECPRLRRKAMFAASANVQRIEFGHRRCRLFNSRWQAATFGLTQSASGRIAKILK